MPNRDPVVTRAHWKVREAVKRGQLRRPETCSECGCRPGSMKDGKPKIQGHHHLGHDRPLDVKWLCTFCHNAVTPQAPRRGTKASATKLTDDIVRNIRRSHLSQRKLGRMYGVDQTAISQIKRRLTWSWLED